MSAEKLMIWFSFLLSLCLSLSCQQNIVEYNVDDEATLCFRMDGVNVYNSGGAVTGTETQCVCVETTVDKFALVSLGGTNDARSGVSQIFSRNSDKSTLINFEMGNKETEYGTLLRHTDGNQDYLNSVMTIVIYLDEGKVDKIIWDDFCDSSECKCIANAGGNAEMCGLRQEECANTSNNCDVKAYVTWFGTDKDGKYLTSAGKRLSRFVKTSGEGVIASAYNSAKEAEVPDTPNVSV